jgi:paraquat-inducible protein A
MSALVACEYCDLLHQELPLDSRGKALCTRCGGILYREEPHSLERVLALNLGALVLLILANVMPFMTFSLEGQAQDNHVISGVILIWLEGNHALGALILFTSIAAPLFKIGASLYVTLPLVLGRVPPGAALVTRFEEWLGPWAMLEVYMLAVIASVVKLAQMASISIDVGAYAFVAVILVSTMASAALDRREVWRRIEAAG